MNWARTFGSGVLSTVVAVLLCGLVSFIAFPGGDLDYAIVSFVGFAILFAAAGLLTGLIASTVGMLVRRTFPERIDGGARRLLVAATVGAVAGTLVVPIATLCFVSPAWWWVPVTTAFVFGSVWVAGRNAPPDTRQR